MKTITNTTILALILTTYTQASSWYIGVEQSLMNNIDNTTKIDGHSYHNDKSSNITSFKIRKSIR